MTKSIMRNFLKVFVILLSVFLIIMTSLTTAFAEPDNETPPEQSNQESDPAGITDPTDPVPSSDLTDPSESSSAPSQEPSDTTGASDPTEGSSASETSDPTEESDSTESEPSEVTPAPSSEETPSSENQTYNVNDLPTVAENEFIVPTSAVESVRPQSATVAAGIISWVCVIIGIIVIIAVLGSSKTGNYMNGGKQRYESGDIISGGKRR